MRKVLLGLAGFVVIALSASMCFADDGEANDLSFSLDLNKLFGATVQESEEKMEWKFKGWGQLFYNYSDGTYGVGPAGPRPMGGNENIRVGRFRFLPGGKYKYMTWGTQFECYSTMTLLDFWVNFECTNFEKDMLQLKVGQFIPPFGIQRPASPFKLCTNYAQITSYLFGAADPLYGSTLPSGATGPGWNNLRDKGVMVHGKMKFGEGEGFRPNVYYGAGIFAGEPANTNANSDPGWTSFLTAKVTPVEDMMIGLSYEDGTRQFVDPTIPADRVCNRDRFGICWQFNLLADPESKSKLLGIQGEYIVGNNNLADLDKHDDEVTAATMLHNKSQHVDGWYLEVSYFIMPKKVKLISKVDILDIPAYDHGTDVRVNKAAGIPKDNHYRKARKYALGVVWVISKHSKIKFLWEQTQNEGRAKLPKISGSEHTLLVCLGVSF